jgi:hypothetical protein
MSEGVGVVGGCVCVEESTVCCYRIDSSDAACADAADPSAAAIADATLAYSGHGQLGLVKQCNTAPAKRNQID